MTDHARSSSSRRNILAAAVGGAVATIAHALGRPLPALATDGDALHVGDSATGTHRTNISVNAADQFQAAAFSADFNGATAGANGSGILGSSDTRAGVEGWGPIGLWGGPTGTSDVAVKGSRGNYAWLFQYPDPHKTAVYGIAITDSGGGNPPDPTVRGVLGRTDAGHAVHGQAGIGVGGYFESDSQGIALQTAGAVRFSSAGINTIQGGSKSKLVSPGVNIEVSTKVFVTLMSNPGAGIVLHRVMRDTVNDQFTVFLTGKPGINVTFAWFVIS